MKHSYSRLLAALGLATATFSAHAQRLGVNTTTPRTALDVHGSIRADSALTITPVSRAAAASLSFAARSTSAIVISPTSGTQANAITLTGTPREGQWLTVRNQDNNPATLAGFTIAAGEVAQLVYLGGAWKLASAPDNLGNHTASQNLDLGANQLVGNGGSSGLAVSSSGNVGIGTTSPSPSALLDLNSTTKGLLPPRLSQAQRTALTTTQNLGATQAGLLIFNTSTGRLNLWDGTAWTEAIGTTNTSNPSPAAQTFTFTGAPQTYQVPIGITSIQVVAIGAKGGSYFGTAGGQGARVTATLPVTPGETLTIYVGGPGTNDVGGAGGYNGGGNGNAVGTGGGATDLRRGSATLADRIVVAGGGGGGSGAGWAGGSSGQTGQDGGGTDDIRGRGATQSTSGAGGSDGSFSNGGAGTLGQGGNGSAQGGGGGGGGYYGGGGGARRYIQYPNGSSNTTMGAGGGGSSYAAPGATGVSYQTTTAASSLTITPLGVMPPAPLLDGSNIVNVPGTYDNLGNHTATTNLNLGSNLLTGGGSAGLRVDASGNVGIGTSAPSQTLEVAGTVYSSAGGFRFPDGSTQTTAAVGDNLGNHTASQNVELNGNWLSNDGGNEGVRIDNTGNVGIGTASPAAKLHVTSGEVRLPAAGGTTHFNYSADGKNYLRGSTVIGDQSGNTVQIGQGGTALNQVIRASFTGQATVSVPGTNHVELTFTVTGARPGATVFTSADANLAQGITVANSYVSANDQVKVRLANYRTGAVNSGATSFYITVIQ